MTNGLRDKKAAVLSLKQHGKHLFEKMTLGIRPRSLSPDKLHDAGMPILSSAAQELLSGGVTGPALREIEIECEFDLKTDETAQFEREVVRLFQQPKDEESLVQLEGDDARRRLLADSWAALALNTVVRELSVNRFVPVWTSAFHDAAFRDLLGRLDSLHVNIFGTKNNHRRINTVPAYRDSLQSILKVLFLHSRELQSLSLHASQHAPLGSRGHYHIPLSLKATQLPQLRHLSLKNCFIGFELAHFVNGHANTLETLELRNCYSYRGIGDGDGEGGMSWAAFLTMITRSGTKLRRFDMSDDYIPLTIDDERLEKYDPESAEEPEDVKNVRRAQKASPRTRLFLYGFLREYSGELWMNKEAILSSFDAEEDQKAWEGLMEEIGRGDGAKAAVGGGDAFPEKSCAVGTVETVELSA